MKWELHHVHLVAFDIPESLSFYRDVLQFDGDGQHDIGRGHAALGLNSSNHATVGDGNTGIHLYIPAPDFGHKLGFPLNPTLTGHVAFNVSDIDAVKQRLDAAGILYAEGNGYAIPGLRQLYFYDPSMNCVEINQWVSP